jgi:hypothetical protein
MQDDPMHFFKKFLAKGGPETFTLEVSSPKGASLKSVVYAMDVALEEAFQTSSGILLHLGTP